jgi:hypothetical protein
MTWLRGAAEACALVFAALLLCLVVGVLNPLPRPTVSTDTLGPDSGEFVDTYIARAEASLTEFTSGVDPSWALVSFDTSVFPTRLLEVARGMRIAQVLVRVPMYRVQTQVITVGVSGSESSVLGAEDAAATTLRGSMGQWDRQAQIDAASVPRLAAGCECVVGMVVRSSSAALLSLRGESGVRAVEALPTDATAGKFAVRALLPEYVDVVGPLPDDGPIPPP